MGYDVELAAAIALILVHTIDDREVLVHVRHITSIVEGREGSDPQRLLTEKANCVLNMTDGKYISVKERCDEVRRLINEATR